MGAVDDPHMLSLDQANAFFIQNSVWSFVHDEAIVLFSIVAFWFFAVMRKIKTLSSISVFDRPPRLCESP